MYLSNGEGAEKGIYYRAGNMPTKGRSRVNTSAHLCVQIGVLHLKEKELRQG
jgi:hypothetical protein